MRTERYSSASSGSQVSLRGKSVLVIADGLSARIASLTPHTSYTFTVAASTIVGIGVDSSPITCSTLEDGEYFKSLD